MRRPDPCSCRLLLAVMLATALGAVDPVTLPTTWPAHPRLIATTADWQALPARRAANPALDDLCNRIVAEAVKLVGQAPLVRPSSGSILEVCSRPLVHRATTLAFAYRTTGEQRFLDQARADLLAVCAYGDWYPSEFLAVAEMSAGVALGYDWLYDHLTTSERTTIRNALKTKALNLASSGREELTRANNWGQVCGGGLGLACLAIGDEDPSLVSTVLGYIRAGIPNSQGAYAPDGVFPEGPIYWNYATVYQALLICGLRANLGDDWGLDGYPGFRASARFFAHAAGPDAYYFNYSDCWPEQQVATAQMFMAKELGAPELAQEQLRIMADPAWTPVPIYNKSGSYPVMCAFWWPDGSSSGAPLYFSGQGISPIAAWRSSWAANAYYLAVKAGRANASHGHMDAGSFVLSCDGVRWGADLGSQDYTPLISAGVDLWNYGQSSSRWSVFRYSSDSHNTLTINGQKHRIDGVARLLSPSASGAVIDMSATLGVTGASRTFSVDAAGGTCTIADALNGVASGASVRWAMATFADIQISGTTARLEQDGHRMALSFQPAGIVVASIDASHPSPSYNAANPGLHMLTATATASASGACTITTTCAEAPATPTSLAATAVSDTQIRLAWGAVARYVTGYEIEQSTGSGWTRIATVAAGSVTYIRTGLVSGTAYQFRVRAVNGAAPSDYSNTATATTLASTSAPVIITQPQPTTVSVGQAATFQVVASGNPAPSYQWRRDGVDIAGANGATYVTPATTTADNGAQFDCVITNSAGRVSSDTVVLTISSSATITPVINQAGGLAGCGIGGGMAILGGLALAAFGLGGDRLRPGPSQRGGSPRRGFTLIELLLVVAIIAVLAGFLLTVIGPIRAAARRVQCAGNLRQLDMSLVDYAQEHHGAAALVYDTIKQGTYFIINNSNQTRSWGVLYTDGLIDTEHLLYCPVTSDVNSGNKYNTSTNPWPHQSGMNTRAGYAVRPEVYVASTSVFPAILPRWSAYAAKAVAADLCSEPDHVDGGHANGVNVAFGDGHVRWCPRQEMAANWLAMPANAPWSNMYDAPNTALWAGFDALP